MADSKGPNKSGSSKTAPETWRFTGAYPCNYLTPDRVSRWVEPGEEIEWPDGPPDSNWEPVEPATEEKPAPSKSDTKE